MTDDLRLASLVSSRICHDLISPVGAISNGLELLAMTGDAGGDEIRLISDSARDASATLRFMRIAYGAASNDERLSAADLAKIARDHLTTARLSVEWRAPGDSLERSAGRIALLAAATAAAALPIGGVIAVEEAGDDPLRVVVSFTGERARLDEAARDILQGDAPPEQANPRQAHIALLKSHAEAMAFPLAIEMTEDEGKVVFG